MLNAQEVSATQAARARPTDFVFVENVGQWPTDARFVARRGVTTIALRENAIDIIEADPRSGFMLRLAFENTGPADTTGRDIVSTRYSYFFGDDPARWRSDVPAYRSVAYADIGAGVDLIVQGGDGLLAYDIAFAPGSSPEDIRIRCDGAEALRVNERGHLVIEVGRHEVRHSAPRAWEVTSSGARRAVEGRIVLRGEHSFGFEVDGRDPSRPLTVQPGLAWSTFFGGSEELATEAAYAVDLAETGAVTFGGMTTAADFPTTPEAFDTDYNGGLPQIKSDAFVAQLDPTGSELIFATYLGGSANESVRTISTAGGVLCLVGIVTSLDFPLTPDAIDRSADGFEAFVTCLSEDGGTLLYSSYFGGSGKEGPSGDTQTPGGIIDARGVVTIVGSTTSADLETTSDALSVDFLGSADVFLSRIDTTSGRLLYSTYLGGAGTEGPDDFCVRGDLVAVTGATGSADFMVTPNAFATTKSPSNDAFVTVFDTEANEIVYSSYLGGSQPDAGHAIHLDENGIATVAGQVVMAPNGRSDFPVTPGAFQTANSSSSKYFVTRMDTNDGTLPYSTFLAGGLGEPHDVVVQSSGIATVVGSTDSIFFPTTLGALQPTTLSSSKKGFVTRLRPDGSGLVYSTFLGGPELGSVFFTAAALDPTGAVVVASDSGAPGFPTTPGAFQPEKAGIMDVVVAKLTILPTGVERIGTSTPGCAGPLAASVWSAPFPEADDFAIDCTDAPPLSTRGLLLFSLGAAEEPLTVKGIDLWLDPSQVLLALPVKSNELGHSVLPLRVPDDPRAAGVTVYAQYVWWDPCGPAGWSSSPALAITIQP